MVSLDGGVCMQSRWRHSVTEPHTRWRICITMATLWQQQDGGYMLFYIFNSTVVDWTCFLFCFRECIILFIWPSVIGVIFILRKFPGNESFRIEIASPFSSCWMFSFSVIVIQKLLKALATSVGSFNFSSFTVRWEPIPLMCFSCSFFLMFHVALSLLFDFAISLQQCCS